VKIGVVIVTHYQLGEQMLQAMHSIIPKAAEFYAVSVSPDQTVDEMRAAISEKLAAAENGQGVLILTDMFGGTPTNLALALLEPGRVEIVTGANLPMLIKFTNLREGMSLHEAASSLAKEGRGAIQVASRLLESTGDGQRESDA